MSKSHYIIPVFVPDLGCPHQCVFCNQKKITGQDKVPNQADVRNIINTYLETIDRTLDVTVEVAFYGGSFTAVDVELQKQLLSPAFEFLNRGEIDGIRVSTRPDAISENILALLSGYGVDTIELGVQSTNDEVLTLSGRGHTSRDVIRAAALIKEWGIHLGFQMIIGLPGDTEEREKDTALDLIALKPDMIRIYPCLVLRNTLLEDLYLQGKYKPLDLNDAVRRSANLLLQFEKHKIDVIRIGLQPTDRISDDGDVVAGPYHPAFRELVESELALRTTGFMLVEKLKLKQIETLRIAVNERDTSVIRGQKNYNTDLLKKVFGIKDIAISTDQALERGAVRIVSVDNQPVNMVMHRVELALLSESRS